MLAEGRACAEALWRREQVCMFDVGTKDCLDRV